MAIRFSVVVLGLVLLAGGCYGLKCKLGVGFLTKEVECKGQWGEMTQTLQKYGANFTDFGSIFAKATSAASGRKKRQADEASTAAPSSTTAAASTTTEDPDAYYCLKHTYLGQSFKSCAPKSVLGISKSLCKEEDPNTCACNTDLCNSGMREAGALSLLILALTSLFLF